MGFTTDNLNVADGYTNTGGLGSVFNNNTGSTTSTPFGSTANRGKWFNQNLYDQSADMWNKGDYAGIKKYLTDNNLGWGATSSTLGLADSDKDYFGNKLGIDWNTMGGYNPNSKNDINSMLLGNLQQEGNAATNNSGWFNRPQDFSVDGTSWAQDWTTPQGMDQMGTVNPTLNGYYSYATGKNNPGDVFSYYDPTGKYVGTTQFQKDRSLQDLVTPLLSALTWGGVIPGLGDLAKGIFGGGDAMATAAADALQAGDIYAASGSLNATDLASALGGDLSSITDGVSTGGGFAGTGDLEGIIGDETASLDGGTDSGDVSNDVVDDGTNYSNEGRNYPNTESTQGSGGSPVNTSINGVDGNLETATQTGNPDDMKTNTNSETATSTGNAGDMGKDTTLKEVLNDVKKVTDITGGDLGKIVTAATATGTLLDGLGDTGSNTGGDTGGDSDSGGGDSDSGEDDDSGDDRDLDTGDGEDDSDGDEDGRDLDTDGDGKTTTDGGGKSSTGGDGKTTTGGNGKTTTTTSNTDYGKVLSDVIQTLLAANSDSQWGRAANEMKTWLSTQMSDVDKLYAPGSAEYNYLWDQMSRKDAAAGRNSQYGPRSVDLGARIAEIKTNNKAKMVSSLANTYAAALNQAATADSHTGLSAVLGSMLGGGTTGGTGGGLGSIFNQAIDYIKNGGTTTTAGGTTTTGGTTGISTVDDMDGGLNSNTGNTNVTGGASYDGTNYTNDTDLDNAANGIFAEGLPQDMGQQAVIDYSQIGAKPAADPLKMQQILNSLPEDLKAIMGNQGFSPENIAASTGAEQDRARQQDVINQARQTGQMHTLNPGVSKVDQWIANSPAAQAFLNEYDPMTRAGWDSGGGDIVAGLGGDRFRELAAQNGLNMDEVEMFIKGFDSNLDFGNGFYMNSGGGFGY